MIRIIREHNTLNGLRFSVVEFVVMAVLVVALGIYFGGTGRFAFAAALFGVGANGMCVVAVGIASIRNSEQDRSLREIFSPSSRALILAKHPDAQRATWLLAALTLVPLAVAALVLTELVRARCR